MKKIPIGIADFKAIRGKNFFYADKTEFLYKLINSEETPYFLSRPRRFGKSLLVSTLKAILEGRRELFKGLWIDGQNYDWTPNPVIHLSLGSIDTYNVDALNSRLINYLQNNIARLAGVTISGSSPADVFQTLITELFLKYNRKVAVLIDEYDAPILAQIERPELAKEIRDAMRSFYTVLKDVEDYRGFTFITGVTKFAKTSIFSTLNNLKDLTLNKDYATICGLTMAEFDSFLEDQLDDPILKAYLTELITLGWLPEAGSKDKFRQLILDWYDGYSWDGQSRVLNPWSICHLFDNKAFDLYWFASGPSKYMSVLAKDWRLYNIFQTDNSLTEPMNAIDVGQMEPIAVLFQAGYLTVDHVDKSSITKEYCLRAPNLEVKAAMFQLEIGFKKAIEGFELLRRHASAMLASLKRSDSSGLAVSFQTLLANLPQNILTPKESYYHTVFLLAMGSIEQKYQAEARSGDGVLDPHLKLDNGDDYVIELKCVKRRPEPESLGWSAKRLDEELYKDMEKAAQKALDQIEDKKYDRKFQGQGQKIFKVALVIGHYSEVVAVIQEAKNWRLVKGLDGLFRVEKS